MKILKIAALVIGAVALAATGIGLVAGAGSLAAAFNAGLGVIGLGGLSAAAGLGTMTTIALGALALDASMVAGALFAPKPPQGGSQTKWKADPYAGIPYVMGRTLVGGNIVYRRGHGANNVYQTLVTVLALGPIQSIDTTFMNRTTVAFNGGGAATGTYAGQIWQRQQLGALPEAAALTSPVGSPPGWTAAHKLSGLAAVLNTFAYDAKSKVQLTSLPSPAHIVHGCYVYDPRLDSTYPGGSGACRAYDEASYVWSEDPHLHALTWALGRWHNGVRVAGIGIGDAIPSGPVRGVDVASFVEGANLNDARGWKIGGQVTTRSDTPWNALKLMLQAGGAEPVLPGGVITAINRAPRVSLATIGPGDIIGEASFSGTAKRRQRINGIIPQYRSESHDWEMVSASEVSVPAYVTLDGGERTREVPYPLVQQVNQVAQLAAYDICDAREAGPGSVPLKPHWLNFRVGDCVTFAPEAGWSIKTTIRGRAPDLQTGAVSYTLRGETDGKHAFALGLTGTAPPIVSLTYSTTIAAPSGDWALTGDTLTANGASIPALVLTGAVANPNADAVVFEYRLYATGLGADDGWMGASIEAPTVTRKEFTQVTPGTQYQVGVSYRVRGVIGQRAVFGPVMAGDLAVAPTTAQGFKVMSGWALTSDDSHVYVAAFTGITERGASLSIAAHTFSGLSASTTYGTFVDETGSTFTIAAAPASTQFLDPTLVFMGWQTTSSSGSWGGGSYPSGYGGSGPIP